MALNPCIRIPIPADLIPVTTPAPEAEADPASVGLTAQGIAAIWDAVEEFYRSGIHPAVMLCLRRKGQVVINRAIGHLRGNGPKEPAGSEKILALPETPVCQFSAPKAVAAMMVHLLAEQGRIHLLDPISHYIPEFGKKGKQHITIFQLLTHRAGIPFMPPRTDPALLCDHEGVLRILCDLKPVHTPGRYLSYHAITSGFIFDQLVRRTTGMNMNEFVDHHVRKPLGFRFFRYGLPPEDIHLAAVNYHTGLPLVFPVSTLAARALGASWDDVVRISNEPRFFEAIIPSGNLYASASEMAAFYQLLLNGGDLNGVRVFQPLTVRRAYMDPGAMQFDRTLFFPIRYSAGMILGNSPVGVYGQFTDQAFGHIGFLNIFCWADPERDLSVALLNTGKALLGPHLPALGKILYRIAKHCSRKTET